jgi:hypothetical protein
MEQQKKEVSGTPAKSDPETGKEGRIGNEIIGTLSQAA